MGISRFCPGGLTAQYKPNKFMMLKSVAALLFLAAAALARPQVDLSAFTPEQQLVIRQHESIALANKPNPIADVPGFAEHQAQVAAVLRLQGVDPGQQAFDN